ncbi:MAG: DUF4352 domain-containing protein [Geodermatophilaceae bacterium]|nr:DUF4352 domain-containing protein [Geodermatophilaceae bacterium]
MDARRVAGAALCALVLTGCNTALDGRGMQAGVPTGGPPPVSTTPPSSSPGVEAGPSTAVFSLGQTGTVTGPDGTPLADITVDEAMTAEQAPNGLGQAPTRGQYLSATVTVDNLGDESFAVAPLDFLARYPGGTRIAYGDGSPGLFAFNDLLDTVALAAGESVTGVIVFDVDPAVTDVQIVYTDLAGRILGAWATT